MEIIAIILWLLGFMVGYIDGRAFNHIHNDKDDRSE